MRYWPAGALPPSRQRLALYELLRFDIVDAMISIAPCKDDNAKFEKPEFDTDKISMAPYIDKDDSTQIEKVHLDDNAQIEKHEFDTMKISKAPCTNKDDDARIENVSKISMAPRSPLDEVLCELQSSQKRIEFVQARHDKLIARKPTIEQICVTDATRGGPLLVELQTEFAGCMGELQMLRQEHEKIMSRAKLWLNDG